MHATDLILFSSLRLMTANAHVEFQLEGEVKAGEI